MAMVTKQDLKALTQERADYCVSIFMSTHLTDPQQDPIRFKNLLRQAEDRLVAQGLRNPEAQEMLKPGYNLIGGNEFWKHADQGLTLFVSAKALRSFRVPRTLDELVVVNNRFYIKPLLPLVTNDGKFFILALSLDSVRVFEATLHDIAEVDLKGVPKNMADAFISEIPERVERMHSGIPAIGERKKSTGVFHGQGGVKDVAKENIQRFFRKVNVGLYRILARETAPLILAGVDYLHPLYRDVNSYPNLLEQGILGNWDGQNPSELHARAVPIVEPILKASQAEMTDKYRQYAGERNGLASADLKEILPAAQTGRVHTLFVALGVQTWGKFDQAAQSIEVHDSQRPGDEDLLDLASSYTYLNDGTVYAVPPGEVPSGTSVGAVFRYAL